MLEIVGDCQLHIFGLRPAERLRRQIRDKSDYMVVATAAAVLSDAALLWLMENPRKLLCAQSGTPLAIAVPEAEKDSAASALESGVSNYARINPEEVGELFVRKLRRRDHLLVMSMDEEARGSVEWKLFRNVYKGVTDIVTKYAWPVPAFHVCRLFSRVGVSPNMVTIAGIFLTLVAAWQFYMGQFLWALIASWLMTFFDTVDGKLARVTVTSSRFGNVLDHGNDYLHPPIWWYCLAVGLARIPDTLPEPVYIDATLILGCYIIGRIIEIGFKKQFGFNQYIWERTDSLFRMIIARRNTILLIFTIGIIIDKPVAAFSLCALWSVISVLLQLLRYSQAFSKSRQGAAISPWLS